MLPLVLTPTSWPKALQDLVIAIDALIALEPELMDDVDGPWS